MPYLVRPRLTVTNRKPGPDVGLQERCDRVLIPALSSLLQIRIKYVGGLTTQRKCLHGTRGSMLLSALSCRHFLGQ